MGGGGGCGLFFTLISTEFFVVAIDHPRNNFLSKPNKVILLLLYVKRIGGINPILFLRVLMSGDIILLQILGKMSKLEPSIFS